MGTNDVCIAVEGLGKSYRLGARERYRTLRDSIVDWAKAPARLLRSWNNARADAGATLWALKDVSFEVRRGEVVGIIGRNGAGKSTLLKILSRITQPDEGRARVRGRVGSLLEVGTGFHPELTGRENIYLNGAILGMRRREIDRKFDEIVAFAETEAFLDVPVKRYSSGMYMRLAFAVAAHLETEILFVDEVLAVGDAAFQKKCLNVMQQVGSQGRTVLFVSHNMPAVTRLCPRTLLLDHGRVVEYGPSEQVIHTYLRSDLGSTAERSWPDRAAAPGNDVVRLRAARVRNHLGEVSARIDIRKPVAVEIVYEVLRPGPILYPNFHMYNHDGVCIFVVNDGSPAWRGKPRPVGTYTTAAEIPGNLLAEGTVIVHLALSSFSPVNVHCWERDALAFEVVDSTEGDSARGDYAGPFPGIVRPMLGWTTRFRDGFDTAEAA